MKVGNELGLVTKEVKLAMSIALKGGATAKLAIATLSKLYPELEWEEENFNAPVILKQKEPQNGKNTNKIEATRNSSSCETLEASTESTASGIKKSSKSTSNRPLRATQTETDRKANNIDSRFLSAKANYSPCVSSSGRKSQHSGDNIARTLEGEQANTVVLLAERMLRLPADTLVNKYAHLNAGLTRMASGARIRKACKIGLFTVAQLQEQLVELKLKLGIEEVKW